MTNTGKRLGGGKSGGFSECGWQSSFGALLAGLQLLSVMLRCCPAAGVLGIPPVPQVVPGPLIEKNRLSGNLLLGGLFAPVEVSPALCRGYPAPWQVLRTELPSVSWGHYSSQCFGDSPYLGVLTQKPRLAWVFAGRGDPQLFRHGGCPRGQECSGPALLGKSLCRRGSAAGGAL